ncbi:MAG: hypothetical protein OXH70_17805 [Acidobacteria bacterium]|nr:hypothetical protein [Acidobacteriota bacterium]
MIVDVIEDAWSAVAAQFGDGEVDRRAVYPLVQPEIKGVAGQSSMFVFPAAVWSVTREGPAEDSRDSSGRERQFTDIQMDFRIDGPERKLTLGQELSGYRAVAMMAKLFIAVLASPGDYFEPEKSKESIDRIMNHRLVSWQYLPDNFGIELVLATVGSNFQARRVLALTLAGSVC